MQHVMTDQPVDVLRESPDPRTLVADMPPPCRGFAWMGQSFDHCDMCGRDISEHEGLDWIDRNGPLFGPSVLIPFDEARQRIPLFAYLVTPTNKPDGPYRYEARGT